MNDREFADYLNKHGAYPRCHGGKIQSIDFHNNDISAADHYKHLGLDPNNLGLIEQHPAGVNAGYVPTLNAPANGVIFDEDEGWT